VKLDTLEQKARASSGLPLFIMTSDI